MALFPPRTPDEIAVLEGLIEDYGVLIPHLLMPDGRMIDGYRRWHLAAKLNRPLSLPNVLPEGSIDEEGLLIARQLRVGRRKESSRDDAE